MPELRAIITDIDGVVAETEDYHRLAYNALFRELGLDVKWQAADYIARLDQVGGAKFTEIMGWLRTPQAERAAMKHELYSRKSALFQSLVEAALADGSLVARPGIRRLYAEALDAGLVLAAASTCVKPAALAILEGALGREIFDQLAAVAAGADVERKKPAPDIYLLAAERAGLDSRDCLAIEDTPHGVAAAVEAGMSCLATPSDYAIDGDFSAAHRVVPDLSEIDLASL
ncbi:MAG: HAD superfamily hydrolase (TIGR01509 family), partial [Rhodothermales bacterium]